MRESVCVNEKSAVCVCVCADVCRVGSTRVAGKVPEQLLLVAVVVQRVNDRNNTEEARRKKKKRRGISLTF